METLANHHAVVTGASSGIGRAIARLLAREGASLCLVGRQLASLEEVASEARARGAQASCYQADLGVDADVVQLLDDVGRDGRQVDILVHAAGVLGWGSTEQSTPEQMDEQYRVNLRAPYVLTRGLLPQLKAARGQVVFVNSTAGLAARANIGQYAATKHALKALADSLREEVNPDGVRVLSLFLGRTASAMQAEVHAREGRPYRPELLMQPDEVAAVAVHALALPRNVEITELSMRPALKSY
jgi:short-subunit dehydrogenase